MLVKVDTHPPLLVCVVILIAIDLIRSADLSEFCDGSVCGRPHIRPNIGNRIIGGNVARRNSWCWQISLQKQGVKGFFHVCGGSLINSRWCVTAAHCVYEGAGPDHFQVILGEHDRSEPSSNSRRRIVQVKNIFIHEDYEGISNYWKNDIAVIELAEDIEFNKYICPVCLPANSQRDDIVNCWATGWGRQEPNGKSAIVLSQVDMNYYNHTICSQPSWYGNQIWEKMICFGHAQGGKGTCQGDSGGPVVCYGRNADHWTLYGLTSWAKGGCAAVNRPTIFTDVSQYEDWIAEKMDENREPKNYNYDYDYDDW